MRISISTVSHGRQRYPTVGDWYQRGRIFFVKVSRMKNPDYMFLVALHEMIEMWLCFRRGIRERDVTRFDKDFERARETGQAIEGYIVNDADEPGNHPNAPYHREHVFATKIEREMAEELGVDWNAYDDTVNNLGKETG